MLLLDGLVLHARWQDEEAAGAVQGVAPQDHQLRRGARAMKDEEFVNEIRRALPAADAIMGVPYEIRFMNTPLDRWDLLRWVKWEALRGGRRFPSYEGKQGR